MTEKMDVLSVVKQRLTMITAGQLGVEMKCLSFLVNAATKGKKEGFLQELLIFML